MLIGMEDGSIRIQNLEKEFKLDELSSHWQLNLHDNNYGHIVKLAVSPDERMLLSAGTDGNLFLYDIMEQEKVDQKVAEAKAKLPSAKVLTHVLGQRFVSGKCEFLLWKMSSSTFFQKKIIKILSEGEF